MPDPTDHAHEFRRGLRDISGSSATGRWQTFRDFLELAYCATARPAQPDPEFREQLEQRYLDTVRKYPRNHAETFAKLLGVATLALTGQPQDFLGTIYEEEGFCDKRYGAQFWTPWHIASFMARMTFPNNLLEQKAVATVAEPACGSGRLVLAFADAAKEHGHDPAKQVWVDATDADRTCQHLCYVQMAVAGIPGIVRHGDSLAMKTTEAALTPAGTQLLTDNPAFRDWLESAPDRLPDPGPTPAPPQETGPAQPEQLKLAL